MRIRLIGEHVYVSIVVLVLAELAVCCAAFILAVYVRFGADLTALDVYKRQAGYCQAAAATASLDSGDDTSVDSCC